MMKYIEQVVTDDEVLRRVSTGAEESTRLNSELSQLSIVADNKQATSGSIFSRLKSTIFASYESNIRHAFVASCKVQSDSHTSDLIAAMKQDGTCSLIKPDVSGQSSAVELCSLAVPHTSDLFRIASIYLGRTQGSLIAISVGGGRIAVLSMKNGLLTPTKNLTLPIGSAQVSGIYLSERHGLVEAILVLNREYILILPDITKPTEYSFVFTRHLRYFARKAELQSLSPESFSAVWSNRFTGSLSQQETSPIMSSLLVGSALNKAVCEEDFTVSVLHEKSLEILRFLHPKTAPANLPPSILEDSLARLHVGIGNPAISYSSLVESEVESLKSSLGIASSSFEISDICIDESARKVLILFTDRTVSELTPLTHKLDQYVGTFLSAPLVYDVVHQRLSRESILSQFGSSIEWVRFFTAASLLESIGSAVMDTFIPTFTADNKRSGEEMVHEKLSCVPTEVRQHILACTAGLEQESTSPTKKGKPVDQFASWVMSELAGNTADLASGEQVLVRLNDLLYLVKCYLVLAAEHKVEWRTDMVQTGRRLLTVTHILHQYGHEGLVERLKRAKIGSIHDLLEKSQIVFIDHPVAEAGYLAASTDMVSHAGLRRFHQSRILAASPLESDRDSAISHLIDLEHEISLFPPFTGQAYWRFVADLFRNDYPREVRALERLSSAKEELLEKTIANGDWVRTHSLISALQQPELQQRMVRVMCTEARIRGELSGVFGLVKDNRDVVNLILADLHADAQNLSAVGIEAGENLFNQIFALSVYVGDFRGAISALSNRYMSLLCRFTSPAPVEGEEEFAYEDVRARLESQVKLLVQCRCIAARVGTEADWMSLPFGRQELEARYTFANALIALYSFIGDDSAAAESLLDDSCRSNISPFQLCRNLSALGLVILASELSTHYHLDMFRACVCPFVELTIRCESDPSALPPCRWSSNSDAPLMPEVSALMSFTRADASGPVGAGGVQLRAMKMALQRVLESANSKHVTLDTARYIYLSKRRDEIPSFLVDLLERQHGWTDLLRLYLRREDYRQAVRLVETHVKHWVPDARDPVFLSRTVLDVPLLVQLQRSLRATATTSDELAFLAAKMDDALETLKQTLNSVTQRFDR